MSQLNQIDCLYRYSVKPGKEAVFQSYIDKVFPVTEKEEPYVLEYSISKQVDGSYLQHERFESEEAIVRHLEKTAAGQADFHESTEIIIMMITGDLTMDFWKKFEGPKFINFTKYREVKRK